MATNTLKTIFQQAVKTEAEWLADDPIIPERVMVFSSDKNGSYKLGNGVSNWSALPYANTSGGASYIEGSIGIMFLNRKPAAPLADMVWITTESADGEAKELKFGQTKPVQLSQDMIWIS